MFKNLLSALKTLFGRMAFFCALIILLPLAVLNRQMVELAFNPFDILRAAPETSLKMPLFMALFLMFALGLLLGYGLRSTIQKPPKNAKPARDKPKVFQSSQNLSAPGSLSGETPQGVVNKPHIKPSALPADKPERP